MPKISLPNNGDGGSPADRGDILWTLPQERVLGKGDGCFITMPAGTRQTLQPFEEIQIGPKQPSLQTGKCRPGRRWAAVRVCNAAALQLRSGSLHVVRNTAVRWEGLIWDGCRLSSSLSSPEREDAASVPGGCLCILQRSIQSSSLRQTRAGPFLCRPVPFWSPAFNLLV